MGGRHWRSTCRRRHDVNIGHDVKGHAHSDVSAKAVEQPDRPRGARIFYHHLIAISARMIPHGRIKGDVTAGPGLKVDLSPS